MPAYPLDEDRNNINGHHQVAMFREITDLLPSSLLELASSFSDFGCLLGTYDLHATKYAYHY